MSNLRIAELDFDQIKTNLRTYLKAQDTFTDYDFEGSGLSTLLDVLAYNTHYNAYLANMLMNEMFLDSAVKRASAVSLAKHLGYTPISARGSKANISLVVNSPNGLPASLTLNRYTPFTSSINGTSYTFLNNEAKTTGRVGTTYTFANVDVIEGALQSYSFAVSDTTPDAKYIIPANNVDTTTLQVTVQTSATDTTFDIYTLSTDITGLDGNSMVYFLEQNPLGNYQIFFGDGVLGKNLTVGNLITVQYLVVTGSAANVSSKITQSFTASGTIGGSTNITITVNSNSTGGADSESITSIKFNAPRINATKNRAVTAIDYESLILAEYAGAESVSVWGGEENVPPIFGKVLISLKPYAGYTISDNTKESIKNTILKNKQVLAIQPQFIDPEYLYVSIVANVLFDPNITTKTSEDISTLINNRINTYFSTNLNKFNKNFYISQFIKYLIETDSSLISVSPEVGIQKRITPTLNVSNVYTGDVAIKYYNRLHPNELYSTKFYINNNGVQTLVIMKDSSNSSPPDYNGTGTIILVNSATNVTISTIGTINYATGVLSITGFTPLGYPTGQTNIQITAKLQEESYNVSTAKNQILVLDDSAKDATTGRAAGITINVTTLVQ